jgi:hypothetical protein
MKKLFVLAILLFASCSWAADYKMIVASGKELGATAYEPTIFHDVYAVRGEDITPTYGVPNPSVMLVEIVVDNDTAAQIFADGGYLILQSQVIPPGEANPVLTILPTEIPDAEALASIASGLSGYGLVYADNGTPQSLDTVTEGCDPLVLKCQQVINAKCTLSATRAQTMWSGLTRAEIKDILVEQMKVFPPAN